MSGGGGGTGAHCAAGDVNVAIMNPHNPPHTLTVPLADVTTGTMKSYMLSAGGMNGHVHTLNVAPADFTTLKMTGTVMVTTIQDMTGHMHVVTLTC